MKNLQRHVVAITGAANGLGKALATEFYRRGCHLALMDMDFEGLQKLKEDLGSRGQHVSIHNVDIAQEKDVISSRMAILEYHQRLDVLINNAGISISQLFQDMDLTDFRNLLEVNFWGTTYCTKHFLPDLLKSSNGRCVNVISDFAMMGFPGKTAYGSSKGAVMAAI